MVIWGSRGGDEDNTGGRYEPVTDTWTPTSLLGAPTVRMDHSAVWTGADMIIFGGWDGYLRAYLNTGWRYDPEADTWLPTSMAAAPEGRSQHAAVWTGSEMVVWGGNGVTVFLNTGGRYNPATDTWRPTSVVAAPTGRYSHTAVWSGSEMIVWGGYNGAHVNTGGKYSPATDAWTPTSTIGAPAGRNGHTAVWTGTRMIVWGGEPDAGDDGGRYDPATDSWTPTTMLGVPTGRHAHTAVWTGTVMVVWGGRGGGILNTGGRYGGGQDFDGDGDGWGMCAGDCNDADPLIHPGAAERCDLVDNNCDGTIDNAVPPGATTPIEMFRGAEPFEASLVWTAMPEAWGYDVVQGDLGILRSTGGDFSLATQTCLANDLSATVAPANDMPAAGGISFYLMRAENCGGAGTYDSGMPGQAAPRDAGINAAPAACP